MIDLANTGSIVKEIVEGQGYVLLPEVITKEEAENARSRLLQQAEIARKTGTLLTEGKHRERIYGLIFKGEIFELMVQHPQVLEVVETILGSEITLGGFSAHILHPGATNMGVHVDYPYWAMEPPFPAHPILEVQTIWLVEDFTEDNGAPFFAPGSQKLSCKPDIKQFHQIAEKITGKAGSVVISHGLCWHDTSTNTTQEPRVSILGNYTPKFIHPLEDNLYEVRPEVLEQASPKLQKLLRYRLKSTEEPIFKM